MSPKMTLWNFNVSVVDSLNSLSILNYQFSYNEKEEQIDYLSEEITIGLDSSATLTIDAARVYGLVENYNLTLPNTPQCNLIKVQHLDIFTKQQCLQYYQSQ
jgi:hypothetical protein